MDSLIRNAKGGEAMKGERAKSMFEGIDGG